MLRPLWAVVPYKGRTNPKRRLASHLSQEERARLVHAMLDDVLTELLASELFDEILLVSAASDAPDLADQYGITFFRDRSTNLPDALIDASRWLKDVHSVNTVFIVPADVPLIQTKDLQQAVAQHKSVTVIPDQHEVGTNGLICTPPNAFPYVFDGKSFKPHLKAADDRNLIPVALRLGSFELDIDTADDIFAIRNSSKQSRTKTYLKSIPIRDHIGIRRSERESSPET